MSCLHIVIAGDENRGFPLFLAAARAIGTATRLGHDRIRVVQGPRTAEWSVDQVRRLRSSLGLFPQPERRLTFERDLELRRPVWTGSALTALRSGSGETNHGRE